jgi:hypothetical protein
MTPFEVQVITDDAMIEARLITVVVGRDCHIGTPTADRCVR